MNTGLYYMYAGFILIPVFAWLMLWSARTIFRRAKEISEENRILPEGAIDTVVLDIGDVLVNFAWRDFIGRHHFSDEIFERIADATVRNDAWKVFDLGNLTYEQIFLNDEDTGMSVKFIRYPAGTVTPLHDHACGHGMYVIRGTLVTDTGRFPAGSFVWFAEGEVMTHGADEADCDCLFITNKPFSIRYL